MTKSRILSMPAMWPIPDGKGHWITRDKMKIYSHRYNCILEWDAGSLNNLASIPWFFKRIFSINGPTRPAAIWHDPAYEFEGCTKKRKFTKAECDFIYYDLMCATKRSVWEAYTPACQRYMEKHDLKKHFMSDKPLVNPYIAKLQLKGLQMAFWREWS